MGKFTEADLRELGMSNEQIKAILLQQEPEVQEIKNDVIKSHEVVKPVNSDDAAKITSFADLQGYANGTVVRFPDFGQGQPFIARVRRPSMLVLAKSGKIPNSLLSTASELFSKGSSGMDTDNTSLLSDMYEICNVIAESALIEPTLEDIHKAGIELSDDQLMAIFSYTQTGDRALEPFRQK